MNSMFFFWMVMVDVDRTMVYHVLGVLQNNGLNPQKDKT